MMHARTRHTMFSRPTPRRLIAGLVVGLAMLVSAGLWAQQRELTSSDRLAILYAPQLNFTAAGDPIIRVGLVEGREAVAFTPSQPIRVLPAGEGGAEIVLPADKTYTVRIDEGRAGEYTHWVVVDELTMAQRGRLDQVTAAWTQRGYLPEQMEVGGLFAIRGKLFDSRRILVGVGGTGDLKAAHKLKRTLERRYGIEGRLHSQIKDYPSGLITLTGEGVDASIRTRDVLWITSLPGKSESIRYTIPGIPKSYGGGHETRQYLGTLIFAPDKTGKLVAMNSLGAERLLRGVVPAEIYASAPQQALRAQAVAARNEIFAAIGVRNLADPYMQRADIYDQVYGGAGAEDPRTTRAVDATRGHVMFYDKQIIEAVYSSNAGGFTADNDAVWDAEPKPYLRGKADAPASEVPNALRDGVSEAELADFLASDFPAYSKKAPVSSTKFYRWKKTVAADEARGWLRDNDRDIGRIKSARVTRRGRSGRVIRLELTGEKGKATVERELNVRRLFGGLRSGLFVMETHRGSDGFIDRFSFTGAGFGHGSGMCQTGAIGMAAAGHDFADILGHYFDGIEVRKLY